jgi:hypothetical protein
MGLIEYANEEHKIIGKSLTVHTVDGKTIKGLVKSADSNVTCIEIGSGFYIILSSAIASMYLSKDNQGHY